MRGEENERYWKRDRKWERTGEFRRSRGREIAELKSTKTGQSVVEGKIGNTSGMRKKSQKKDEVRERSRGLELSNEREEGLTVTKS